MAACHLADQYGHGPRFTLGTLGRLLVFALRGRLNLHVTRAQSKLFEPIHHVRHQVVTSMWPVKRIGQEALSSLLLIIAVPRAVSPICRATIFHWHYLGQRTIGITNAPVGKADPEPILPEATCAPTRAGRCEKGGAMPFHVELSHVCNTTRAGSKHERHVPAR